MTKIDGNTYPVREQIKALGGKWDPTAKAWSVPDDKADEARRIVANAPKEERKPLSRSDCMAIAARKRGEKPGVCSVCGEKCKYPYTECWDCREERAMGY